MDRELGLGHTPAPIGHVQEILPRLSSAEVIWLCECWYNCHPSSLNVPTFIGLNHTSSSGIITSPGWPGNYLHNQDCLDIISAPGKTITVTFQTFYLENCQCDFVTGITKSNDLYLKLLSALALRFCLAPTSFMRNKISAKRWFLNCLDFLPGSQPGCILA